MDFSRHIAFIKACANGDLQCMQQLVCTGLSVSDFDNEGLYQAVCNGHRACIDWLAPQTQGSTLLSLRQALEQNDTQTVDLLWGRNDVLEGGNDAAVYTAAANGWWALVEGCCGHDLDAHRILTALLSPNHTSSAARDNVLGIFLSRCCSAQFAHALVMMGNEKIDLGVAREMAARVTDDEGKVFIGWMGNDPQKLRLLLSTPYAEHIDQWLARNENDFQCGLFKSRVWEYAVETGDVMLIDTLLSKSMYTTDMSYYMCTGIIGKLLHRKDLQLFQLCAPMMIENEDYESIWSDLVEHCDDFTQALMWMHHTYSVLDSSVLAARLAQLRLEDELCVVLPKCNHNVVAYMQAHSMFNQSDVDYVQSAIARLQQKTIAECVLPAATPSVGRKM